VNDENGKDLEGSGRDKILRHYEEYAWRDREKPQRISVRIAVTGPRFELRTNLPYMKQEWCSLYS
jgi:hypothetical protein